MISSYSPKKNKNLIGQKKIAPNSPDFNEFLFPNCQILYGQVPVDSQEYRKKKPIFHFFHSYPVFSLFFLFSFFPG
jgi:hypothetical protein